MKKQATLLLLGGNYLLGLGLGVWNYDSTWTTYDQSYLAAIIIREYPTYILSRPHNIGQFLPAQILTVLYSAFDIPLTEAAYDIPYVMLYATIGILAYYIVKSVHNDVTPGLIAAFAVTVLPITVRAGRIAGNGYLIFATQLQLLSLITFWKYFRNPSRKHALLFGVAYGLTILTDPFFMIVGPSILSIIFLTRTDESLAARLSSLRKNVIELSIIPLSALLLQVGVFLRFRAGVLQKLLYEITEGEGNPGVNLTEFIDALLISTNLAITILFVLSLPLAAYWILKLDERITIFVWLASYCSVFLLFWKEPIESPEHLWGFFVWAAVPVVIWTTITLYTYSEWVSQYLRSRYYVERVSPEVLSSTIGALLVISLLLTSVALVTGSGPMTGPGIPPYEEPGAKAAGTWMWEETERTGTPHPVLAIGYDNQDILYYFPPSARATVADQNMTCLAETDKFQHLVISKPYLEQHNLDPESGGFNRVVAIKNRNEDVAYIYSRSNASGTPSQVETMQQDYLHEKFNSK